MPDQSVEPLAISTLTHPLYAEAIDDWVKWRRAYIGGRIFVNNYLEQFSSREDGNDFKQRKGVTYSPSFAKVAVNEVKNSIFQRMSNVSRSGGTPSYIEAVKGGQFGVDRVGSTMTEFMGRDILRELLVMRKVGIYVDMPRIDQLELLSNESNSVKRPYVYYYSAEDIRSWTYDMSNNPTQFSSVLLRQQDYVYDPVTHLPSGENTIFRHFWLENGRVYVKFYNDSNEELNYLTNQPEEGIEPLELGIDRIPFVVLELSASLMTDIADYQIALLNINSSDIMYILKANYPFYTEQKDTRAQSPYVKSGDQEKEIDTGVNRGRSYPMGAERPGFINPSTEPLLASMKKQEQIKAEIRQLVSLTVANLEPRAAESKGLDNQSVEAGLSYIGLELEHAERQVGQIWTMYEKANSQQYPTISYPEKYNLKSDEENRAESKELVEMMPIIPSQTYQKNIAKEIARKLLERKITVEDMKKIEKEIDSAPIVYVPPDVMVKDVENGLVDLETASSVRGYPKGSVDKAKNDHADRLARISIAQSKGAGNPDTLPKPGDAKPLKDKTLDATVQDNTRGKGKE